jgi:hypothetical protein
MPEGAGAGRTQRRRPRCCRWAKTGPHRWEREVHVCHDNWLQLTMLYWSEGPTDDDVFCSTCGHTMGCHLRARRQHVGADGMVLDAAGAPVSTRA